MPARYAGPPLQPANISADRIIRIDVGLRPFRASGYVVRSEVVGSRTVIHNYGHGGAGVTLSWGTAHEAVALAGSVADVRCAVIGCGAVGLATARLLQRRGARVTIYAKHLPPDTTSNLAGGHWWPYSVFDAAAVDPAFMSRFHTAVRVAYREFQHLLGPHYGVHWRRSYAVSRQRVPLSAFTESLRDVAPELALLAPGEHPFGSAWVQRHDAMMIEPSIYLQALVEDVRQAGGEVAVRSFAAAHELAQLPEPLVFNCTGLGARELFDDPDLIPARGQLVVLLPQPGLDYNLFANGSYAFPRSDGVVLGGTFQRNDWSTDVDPRDTRRILDGAAAAFAQVAA